MNSKSSKVAKPYADAFLEIAKEAGSLDATINDLSCIVTALDESQDLEKAIQNPLISVAAKKDIVKSVFSGNVSGSTVKFMMVLCDRGRIEYLESIGRLALELAYKQASIEIAYVKSSTKMSSKQQEALTEKLKAMTGAEQIKLDVSVDKDLIGGFTVQVGSQIIDTSIQNQLKQLSAHLGASSL